MSEVRAALGPGDEDPRSPVLGLEESIRGPLGAGEDDPRSPAGQALPVQPPPGPGEGDDPHAGYYMLAPRAAGGGDAATGPLTVTHVPIRQPALRGHEPATSEEVTGG